MSWCVFSFFILHIAHISHFILRITHAFHITDYVYISYYMLHIHFVLHVTYTFHEPYAINICRLHIHLQMRLQRGGAMDRMSLSCTSCPACMYVSCMSSSPLYIVECLCLVSLVLNVYEFIYMCVCVYICTYMLYIVHIYVVCAVYKTFVSWSLRLPTFHITYQVHVSYYNMSYCILSIHFTVQPFILHIKYTFHIIDCIYISYDRPHVFVYTWYVISIHMNCILKLVLQIATSFHITDRMSLCVCLWIWDRQIDRYMNGKIDGWMDG